MEVWALPVGYLEKQQEKCQKKMETYFEYVALVFYVLQSPSPMIKLQMNLVLFIFCVLVEAMLLNVNCGRAHIMLIQFANCRIPSRKH